MSGQRDEFNKDKNKENINKGQTTQKPGSGFGQGQQRQDQNQRPGQNQPGSTNKGWGSTSGTNLPKDKGKTDKDRF